MRQAGRSPAVIPELGWRSRSLAAAPVCPQCPAQARYCRAQRSALPRRLARPGAARLTASRRPFAAMMGLC